MSGLPTNFGAGQTYDYRRKLSLDLSETWDWYLRQWMAGGLNGVLRHGALPGTGALNVTETSTPSMSVLVASGVAIVNGIPRRLPSQHTLAIPPLANPSSRWDLICINADGSIVLHRGTGESDPSVGNDVKLFRVVHRVGESSIKTTDDATNGYLEDVRTWVN